MAELDYQSILNRYIYNRDIYQCEFFFTKYPDANVNTTALLFDVCSRGNEFTPLGTIFRDLPIVQLLLEHGADPNATEQMIGLTALATCALHNNAHIMPVLLDRPDLVGDINNMLSPDGTALHYAARYGSPGAAKVLLLRGADPNCSRNNADRATPLDLCVKALSAGPATKTSCIEVGQMLLDFGADPNSLDHSLGTTPLYEAAFAGCSPLVKTLLEHKANPNVQSMYRPGYTPIIEVIEGTTRPRPGVFEMGM